MTARNLEQSANKAIQNLREQKLQQSLPFMIDSDILEYKPIFYGISGRVIENC
jgi:hypothetical protein